MGTLCVYGMVDEGRWDAPWIMSSLRFFIMLKFYGSPTVIVLIDSTYNYLTPNINAICK